MVSRSGRGKGGTNNINNGSAQEMIAMLLRYQMYLLQLAMCHVREMCLPFLNVILLLESKENGKYMIYSCSLCRQSALFSVHIPFVAMLSLHMKDLSLCWQRYSHMFHLVNRLASPGLCRTLSKSDTADWPTWISSNVVRQRM